MRDEPNIIRRVAMKAAAELVIHSAACHLVEREREHFQNQFIARFCVRANQKFERHRLGKFWRAAKTAVFAVERAHEVVERKFERARIERHLSRAARYAAFTQRFLHLGAVMLNVVAPRLPCVRNSLQHVHK
ncbi:MAG: hypothetical protein HDKAJFGB_00893 [Anaerolineae bacterium]|nr:hypothetical protein [Anaerolineae bacterium]